MTHRCACFCPCCRATPSCTTENGFLVTGYLQITSVLIIIYNLHLLKFLNRNLRVFVKQSKFVKIVIKDLIKQIINATRKKSKYCYKNIPNDHICYIQPLKTSARKKFNKILFLFYDFKSRKDSFVEGTTDVYELIPTLCVTQQACPECINCDDLAKLCFSCGVREQVFDIDPVKQFVEYVLKPTTFKHI